MKLFFKFNFLLFIILFIVSCSSEKKIIDEINLKISVDKIKGKYAFFIHPKKWNMIKKYDYSNCDKKINLDFDTLFLDSMTQNIKKIFVNPSFYNRKLSEKEIKTGGYISQVEILRTNGSLNFIYDDDYSHFFAKLNGIISFRNSENFEYYKNTISVKSSVKKENIFECESHEVSEKSKINSISEFLSVTNSKIYKIIKK